MAGAAELDAERRALATTLQEVGPAAPTLIPGWSASDLAAHVAATEQLRGVPTFLGRRAVRRFGWRLNDTFRPIMDADRRRFHRHGFGDAIARLERPVPWLLARPSVLPVAVFEVVVHHEDVRRASPDIGVRQPDVDLLPAIDWLLGYQRKLLGGTAVTVELADGRSTTSRPGRGEQLRVSGPALEVLVWLAGRQSVADVVVEGTGGDALRV